jgi:hypothetical protein
MATYNNISYAILALHCMLRSFEQVSWGKIKFPVLFMIKTIKIQSPKPRLSHLYL